MALLRLVRRQVAMNVMVTIEYRGAFFVFMLTTAIGPLISLLVWLAASEQGVALPYGRREFVTYFVLLGLVDMLTGVWLGWYLADDIRRGALSPLLLRPASFMAHYIGNNIGEKVVKLPLLLPLVALVAIAFRTDFRPPVDAQRWLLFILALPLAAATAFWLEVAIASLAFWMQDVRGLLRVKHLLAGLLAGQFVPLALFPPVLQTWLEVQPFRYILSFPLEVLTGHLGLPALWRGFAWQILYAVAFWALYRLLWSAGLRRYEAPGG